ncbi:hypothetical protein FA95DRAFT_1610324 [Auriscalpium vulgare]|uniref:Uncharacterized protein n=1 Tax=Auriscalpium vulgare TaxID=40419 RepID=A0ACB8RE28_9AGAM|nr:hypothetical protein FA95DRAFT_1610324 [Auriscalpium vulgare]
MGNIRSRLLSPTRNQQSPQAQEKLPHSLQKGPSRVRHLPPESMRTASTLTLTGAACPSEHNAIDQTCQSQAAVVCIDVATDAITLQSTGEVRPPDPPPANQPETQTPPQLQPVLSSLSVTRDDVALLRLVSERADLSAADPAILTIALYNALGFSTTEFQPSSDFVIYLEYIEDKARYPSSSNRTHPAESLSAAAYSFLSRPAVHSPLLAPSTPRHLVPNRCSDWEVALQVYRVADLSKVNPTRLAQALYNSLGLKSFGPCPPPETVILLEFLDAQLSDPALHSRRAPAKSLVGAAYYFMFRRAARKGGLPHRDSLPHVKKAGAAKAEEILLRHLDMHPDLREADPGLLAAALYQTIGVRTDPRPVSPDPESVVRAEFLDDQRHYNPDRAVQANSLVDAAYNYLRRRCVETPIAAEGHPGARVWPI